MSHLLAWSPRHIQFVFNLILDIHAIVNWKLQNSASPDQCHTTVSGFRFLIHWGDVLLKFFSGSCPFFWEEFNFLLAFGESWIVSRKTLLKRFLESFWSTYWFWPNYSWRKIKVRNKIDYYSFKIFYCFWLVQIPQLIGFIFNQLASLALTKFGKRKKKGQ